MLAYTRQKAKAKYRDRMQLEREINRMVPIESNRMVPIKYHMIDQAVLGNVKERMRPSGSMTVPVHLQQFVLYNFFVLYNLLCNFSSTSGAIEIMQVDDEITSILTADCVGTDCV
ncbi:hypothetical protein TNCT_366771 [Trichonephila clavata]|uniref:Uncharacterized protein n=1 Tax=Trichonephila clavata TaxID=2740835 RepID=A0A8X6M552_TRICU|nr:hypothetical protein TNCT_366771 [Trichonephila clavata]